MIGQIYIRGVIGQEIGLVDIISQVNSQKDASAFRVEINTKGGSVKEGNNIYNYLKSLGLPIEMIGVNCVASIGTVIFMAGNTRRIEQGTNFFIHLPSIPELQNATADDLDAYSKEMRKIESDVINFYAKHTGLTTEAIKPMLENQTYLNEEQLFTMGFTTQKESLPVQAVAFLDKQLINKDEIMNTEKSKQAKSIVSMINKFLGMDVQMKTLLTADQTELIFGEVEDEAMVQVGDTALLDGAAPEGDVMLADGRTLRFEAGVVTEIVPAADANYDEEEDEEMTKLKEENTMLKSELEKTKATNVEQATTIESVEAKLLESKNILKSVEKIQSQMLVADKKVKKENKKETSKLGDSVNALLNL
ncbi:ATP-dependent Clp protease proteolytic subunit [Flavobacteriaceae bacterium]|nr:ATP-dependent Clp protease proteolytic subunit [Flavobacteriaceae bacterium]MDB9980504.1 ATP-dependent Clp protease proteolytic subunit [bacterium]